MRTARLIADIPPDTVAAATGEDSSNWPVIVAIVAAVCVVLVGVGVYLRRRQADRTS